MVLRVVQGTSTRRLAVLALAVLAAWVLLSPVLASAFAGLGGYISEVIAGDGANETVLAGDGTNGLVVAGSVPVVSTLSLASPSTSAGGVVTAALRGDLQNLNGMPRADVYFEWGYAPGSLTNTTATSTVTATGVQTTVINPAAGLDVFYQFVAGTDGTSRGGIESFFSGGAHGVSYWIIHTLLPIVIALAVLVAVFLLTGNPILALTSAFTGLIAFYIVVAFGGMF